MWPFRTVPLEAKTAEDESLASPGDELLDIFTGTTVSTFGMARADALRVPAVSAAIRLISEAVATLEPKVMRRGADGKETEVPEHPVAALLNGDANDWLSGFELIRNLVIEALASDSGGLAWVNRLSSGAIGEVVNFDSGVMGVTFQQSGEPEFTVKGQKVDRSVVIHVMGPFRRCPLTMAMRAIFVSHVMEQHAGNLFAKGARPSGVLQADKSAKPGAQAIKNILAGWRRAHEGADNSGKTAVLYGGFEWKAMSLNSVDSQFLELRKFQILEIARAFRIPPSMLFELDRATWSNSEQMGKEFLTYSLEPWLRATEVGLTRGLFTPEERKTLRVHFDRDDLTRADFVARMTAYSTAIASRIINPNQARKWEKLDPYDGGDEYMNPNITIKPAQQPQKEPLRNVA